MADTLPAALYATAGENTAVTQFVEWLSANGYRLPDGRAQAVPGTTATPDLIYQAATTAVFIDSPDRSPTPGRDAIAEEGLFDAGWNVLRAPAGEWQSTVDTYPRVFGSHREESTG